MADDGAAGVWKARPVLRCEACGAQVVPLTNGDLVMLAGQCPKCGGDLDIAGTCLVRRTAGGSFSLRYARRHHERPELARFP